MSSKLSAAAKHRISGFLTPQELRETKKVDREWRLIVELFFSLRLQKFCPSTDYLRSKEFELTLNNGSVDNAVRLIFEGGRPTKFWLRIPDGLIPKMVEVSYSRYAYERSKNIIYSVQTVYGGNCRVCNKIP